MSDQKLGDCIDPCCGGECRHAQPARRDSREAVIAKLAWIRKFIEYARYELQPGVGEFGDQFPRQDAADKAIAELDASIALLRETGA